MDKEQKIVVGIYTVTCVVVTAMYHKFLCDLDGKDPIWTRAWKGIKSADMPKPFRKYAEVPTKEGGVA